MTSIQIEKTLKFIPVISLFILISSIIKNYIYYDYFGININEFTSLSEFTLLFISEIKLYLIFILVLILFLPIILLRNYTQAKFGEKNLSYSLTYAFTSICLILCPVKIIMIMLNENDNIILIKESQNWLIIFFISILFLVKKDITLLKNLYLFFCVITLLIFSTSKAYTDIENVKKNKPNYEIEFVYENKIYKSKTNYIFIGKTHDYIFIHNLRNKYTEIFKIQDVKLLKLKKL